MASWAMEALQCRKPAKSYALYLKDQWLQFQINTLPKGASPHSKIIISLQLYVAVVHQTIGPNYHSYTCTNSPFPT